MYCTHTLCTTVVQKSNMLKKKKENVIICTLGENPLSFCISLIICLELIILNLFQRL